MRALLVRRVGAHPAALVAVATSVLTSMLVVATLQLLSVGIADAGARAELGGPAAERGVVVTASLRPGELADSDGRVRAAVAAGGRATLTRTATATTRGLVGGAATDRVLLADLDGLERRARLLDGQWPAAPAVDAAPGDDPVEAVLPENVARELGVSVGDRLTLTELISREDPPLEVLVSGVFVPTGVDDGLWAEDPLGLRGVVRTDYTTFGPVVLAAGSFDGTLVGTSFVSWRWTPSLDGLDDSGPAVLAERVDGVVDRLQKVAGIGTSGSAPEGRQPLRDGRVSTSLPAVIDRAILSHAQVRAALLAPTVLLVVLGISSLVVAAALLAALRDPETRLLRTRGASTVRLASLSLADALTVVLVGVAGSLLVAPALARWVAGSAGLSGDRLSTGSSPVELPWVSVVVMGLLAIVVVVTTTLRVGRARGGPRGGARGATRVLRALGSSGLDVALVGLSVLGVVQLRRYDSAASSTADPLTIAAPALVLAGSSVLCLRLLPVLSRQVARLTSARPGLDVAWGGWQLSRRLAGQSGTVLLVLLAVSMGTLALSHSATARQAVEDQSAFETGGQVRVVTGAVAGPRLAAVGSTLAQAAGGEDRITPVYRESAGIGPIDGITVLGVDAVTASRVADPRADLLAGQQWRQVAEKLAVRRAPLAAPSLPEGADTLTLRLSLTSTSAVDERFEIPSSVLLRDGTGLLTLLPLGAVGPQPRDLTVDLPVARGGPWQLMGVVGSPGGAVVTGGGSLPPSVVPGRDGATLQVRVEGARAGTTPLDGLDRLGDRSTSETVLTSVLGARVDAVPVVLTRGLSDAVQAPVGQRLELPVAGRRLTVEVVALVDAVPTAPDPTRAVLLDLPTALVTPDPPASDRRLSTRVVVPNEWWLAPQGAVDTEALQSMLPNGSTVQSRVGAVAVRLANPVNAGMRAAMLLVTASALVLASVGFGATTAALARERRRENAVLLALGMSPRRIRRTLEAERVAVVVLTVVVGLVLGVLSALAVVPVLVGGDGHRQVPEVLVSLPWPRLAGFAAVVAAVLALVGVLVLRRVGGDVVAELRRGES